VKSCGSQDGVDDVVYDVVNDGQGGDEAESGALARLPLPLFVFIVAVASVVLSCRCLRACPLEACPKSAKVSLHGSSSM
jgi:hypothetical protein